MFLPGDLAIYASPEIDIPRRLLGERVEVLSVTQGGAVYFRALSHDRAQYRIPAGEVARCLQRVEETR